MTSFPHQYVDINILGSADEIQFAWRYDRNMITNASNQSVDTDTSIPCVLVLICDDELHAREALKSLLTIYTLSKSDDTIPQIKVVGMAANGQEAIQRVAEYHPDVVLMDALMPVMDGFEATRIIKSRWPQVKVVMLTMYSAQQSAAMAAGVDAFLLKGCPAEELLDTILPTYKTDFGHG